MPSKITPLVAVRYYSDGFRLGIVLSLGSVWVRLLDYGTLTIVKLPAHDAGRMQALEYRLTKRMAGGIRRRAAFLRRNGVSVPTKSIKLAIQKIRETTK